MTVGTDTLLGDMHLEGGSQGWQVQVAVDTAELLAGSTRPAAHQRRAMSPLCQFFTLAEWLRQIEIIDSMQFVLRRVRARVGGTPRRSTVNDSARPARRLPARRVGVFQFPCQRFELGLGDDRRRRVVGGSHLLRHRRSEISGQPVGDVSERRPSAIARHSTRARRDEQPTYVRTCSKCVPNAL